jgi:hypothetical protein
MKAGLRVGLLAWTAALAFAAAPALAQEATQATTNAPAPSPAGTVGPQELQNFDLQGPVDRSADQPLRPASPPTRTQPPSTQNVVQSVSGTPERTTATPTRREGAEAPQPAPATEREARAQRTASAEPLRQTPPASSVTVALPRLDNGAVRSSASAPAPVSVATAGMDSPATVPTNHELSILPWLLAAFALGAGAAFLFLRNRAREAFAGGPEIDAFVSPQPVPAPAPTPAPELRAKPTVGAVTARKRPEPSIPGIVTTRLRPQLEIGFRPISCLVEDHQVTFEFEVELFNSGNAPARGVLIEASLFNASNEQDQQLEAFFANPRAEGERIPAIPQLKSIRLTSKVVTPREHVQVYEVNKRKVFVPIIGFNGLYRWGGGEGQTSVSFLLGIDTKREKMAPFRVDLGRRTYTSVTARELPTVLRR